MSALYINLSSERVKERARKAAKADGRSLANWVGRVIEMHLDTLESTCTESGSEQASALSDSAASESPAP